MKKFLWSKRASAISKAIRIFGLTIIVMIFAPLLLPVSLNGVYPLIYSVCIAFLIIWLFVLLDHSVNRQRNENNFAIYVGVQPPETMQEDDIEKWKTNNIELIKKTFHRLKCEYRTAWENLQRQATNAKIEGVTAEELTYSALFSERGISLHRNYTSAEDNLFNFHKYLRVYHIVIRKK